MLKQTIATKLSRMYYVKSLNAFMSTQVNVHSVVSKHLNIDLNNLRKIKKFEVDNIMSISPDQVEQNCVTMQSMEINLEHIQYLAPCLKLSPMLLRNRISVLKEMGVKSVSLQDIYRFPNSMRKSINSFKRTHNIANDENVMKIILSNIGISNSESAKYLAKIDGMLKASDYYKVGMFYFKMFHLNLQSELFPHCTKTKYRSFKELSTLVDILKTKCHFDNEFIQQNPTLLNLTVESVETFLNEFKNIEINGKDMPYILKKYPRILFLDVNKVKEFLHLYQILKIPDQSLLSYIAILGMTKEKFLQRFIDGDVSYCAQRKYLAYIVRKELGEENMYIIRTIQKHRYWKHIPLLHINKMLQYLKKYYSVEDICDNIHLVLYPWFKVVEVLDSLYKEYSLQKESNFSDKQYLALCLYKLEKKYHFSGDGVWQTMYSEMSDFHSSFVSDIEENKSNNLIRFVKDDNKQIQNANDAE